VFVYSYLFIKCNSPTTILSDPFFRTEIGHQITSFKSDQFCSVVADKFYKCLSF